MAPLVMAAVVVFGFGMASAVLTAGPHAASTEKNATKAQPNLPNAAVLTALLHPPGGLVSHAQGGPSHLTGSITTATSSNWAGYVDVANAAGTITEISAEWAVPTVTCSEASGVAYAVQWIGIDGYGTASVEQVGSLEFCSGPGATPAYDTWWEFFPANSIQLYAATSPGAFISADIVYNPAEEVNGISGVYTMNLFDVDNSVAFSVIGGGWDLGYTPADGTAECISEAPSSGVTIFKLAHYGQVTFGACDTTIGTHATGIGNQGSTSTIYRVNQVQTHTDQTTGGLSSYFGVKSTFTITWKNYH
jgi:peptidase A4-like protein